MRQLGRHPRSFILISTLLSEQSLISLSLPWFLHSKRKHTIGFQSHGLYLSTFTLLMKLPNFFFANILKTNWYMLDEVKWGYEINHNIKIQFHRCYTYGQVDSTTSLFQQPSIDFSVAFQCFSYANTSWKV